MNRWELTWIRRMACMAGLVAIVARMNVRADDNPLSSTSPPTASVVPAPQINTKILEFARDQFGKSVRDGECTSLVFEALKFADGKFFPPYSRDGDYIWGVPLTSRTQVRPGDILQFRNVVFRGREQTTDQNGTTSLRFYRLSFDHHPAIVDEVQDRGRVLVILHQNAGSDDDPPEVKRSVHRDTLRLGDQRPGEGKLWYFRPVPRVDPKDKGPNTGNPDSNHSP